MNTEPRRAAGNLKKKMLLVIGIVLVLMLVMVLLISVLESWLAKAENEQPTHGTPQTIIFHSPNYEEDITKDAHYMGLDRQIYYADLQTGVTISLSEATYAEQGEAVELLCHMIESIIAGDHETYNTFFSEQYLEREGEKDMFTAQKLYCITITELSSEDVQTEEGKYEQYTFSLEYMICQNNGTFRTDVGSDAIRKQAVVVTNREGRMLIDVVSGYTYSYT